MKILVTGGAGYIGSHTILELLNNNYDVVVIDNLINSSYESIKRVMKLTGKKVSFYEEDLLNETAIDSIFKNETIDKVIHFAGLKAVGESVENPLLYYNNNLTGTINLLNVMNKYNVKDIVFSSSATVYGKPKVLPIKEEFEISAVNPYGNTKLIIEEILKDIYISDKDWNIVILRYFNPIGAHESGLIGENPKGIPNNLIPYVAQVAVGKLPYVKVFGNDYETKDGTGVRDYIHVVDLAKGHVKAIEKIEQDNKSVKIYNLGTGNGYSVLEIIKCFEKACGKKIKYKILPRRFGDIAECYADAGKAKEHMGWVAEKNLQQMCEDSWNWQVKNPDGYSNNA